MSGLHWQSAPEIYLKQVRSSKLVPELLTQKNNNKYEIYENTLQLFRDVTGVRCIATQCCIISTVGRSGRGNSASNNWRRPVQPSLRKLIAKRKYVGDIVQTDRRRRRANCDCRRITLRRPPSDSRFHLTRRWWSVRSQTDTRRVAAPIRCHFHRTYIRHRAPGQRGRPAAADSNWPRSTGLRPPG